MRADFYVLGPARPADPHIELEFLNHRLYPELSAYSGLDLTTPAVTPQQQAYPPYFRGTKDAAFLPDIICNDHGLPLWKDALVKKLIEIDRYTPMSRTRANIGIKGGRKPLAEGATIIRPNIVYGDEVIDWEGIARRDPDWARNGRPSGLRLLNREQIVLGDRLGAALCGPNAELELRHCHAARLSSLGYEQAATIGATPPDRYADLLEQHLHAAKARSRKGGKQPSPPLSDEERQVRREILAMFAQIGQQTLSGNRETWSKLKLADGKYQYICGQADSPDVSTKTVSEQEAWDLLRIRAAEGLGLFTFKEQENVKPGAILDYYQSIWRKQLDLPPESASRHE